MIGYIRYGNIWDGVPIYTIIMRKELENGWFVEVIPCDAHGQIVSDPVVWDNFACWWHATSYFIQQYLDFYNYVNTHL